jgi:hypothetical protein
VKVECNGLEKPKNIFSCILGRGRPSNSHALVTKMTNELSGTVKAVGFTSDWPECQFESGDAGKAYAEVGSTSDTISTQVNKALEVI